MDRAGSYSWDSRKLRAGAGTTASGSSPVIRAAIGAGVATTAESNSSVPSSPPPPRNPTAIPPPASRSPVTSWPRRTLAPSALRSGRTSIPLRST